ncbi:hypothetical protein ACOMHN_030058 [Nucella lapillus]
MASLPRTGASLPRTSGRLHPGHQGVFTQDIMASLPRTSGRLYPGHQGVFTQDIPYFGLWQPLSLHPKYPRDITLFQFVLCHMCPRVTTRLL